MIFSDLQSNELSTFNFKLSTQLSRTPRRTGFKLGQF